MAFEFGMFHEFQCPAGKSQPDAFVAHPFWGPEYVGDRQYLRTFIQRLRRKLEADAANPTVINTVGRLGYRFGPMPSNATV